MGEKRKGETKHPVSTILAINLLMAGSFLVGAALFYRIHPLAALGYLVICIVSLAAAMRYRCVFCTYHGRRCASGMGILAGRLFKKSDPAKFNEIMNQLPAVVTGLLATALPLVGGAVLLVARFTWQAVLLFAAYVLITVVFSVAKKRLCCCHCEQGELGCPAFNKTAGS